MSDEGVVKFICERVGEPLEPEPSEVVELAEQHEALRNRGWIGVDSAGIAYGNISARSPARGGFIITGTGAGALAHLQATDCARVVEYSLAKNRVRYSGATGASSETLSHAALYAVGSAISAVVHIHLSAAWRALLDVVPTTAYTVPYGTPAMADEIMRLYRETDLPELRILAMGGHESGIITFGEDLAQAVQTLEAYCR